LKDGTGGLFVVGSRTFRNRTTKFGMLTHMRRGPFKGISHAPS